MEEANETTVAEFMLLGLSGVRDKLQMFLFFVLLLTYLVTLTGNSLIIFIVWVDHRLHIPMYFFISNLSSLEIWFTSVTNPKVLLNFLSDSKTISFLACMAQSYFYFTLGAVEFILLMVMSFDRYVAICHPFVICCHHETETLHSTSFCLLGGRFPGYKFTDGPGIQAEILWPECDHPFLL
ncbi:unnamed protein product [Natator depressus]